MQKVKRQLDLGCGNSPRKIDGVNLCFGVDINPPSNNKDILYADLSKDPLPFGDDVFDFVTAYDFMEHIPSSIHIYDPDEEITYIKHSMIDLFNEIFRVLKHNGIFHMESPCYPSSDCFRDPQHVYVWTSESIDYFSGDYYGFHDHYHHTSRFKKVKNHIENGRLIAEIRAIKNLEDYEPYTN